MRFRFIWQERESNHVRYTLKLDTLQYFFAVKESNSGIINVSLKFKTQQNTKAENMECYTNEKLVLKKNNKKPNMVSCY